MSPQTTLSWIPIPQGRTTSGDLSLAVFVALRVTVADGEPALHTLEELSTLRDWPAALAGCRLTLSMDPGTNAPARVVSTADSELWVRMFGADTTVEAFQADDLTNCTVLGYRSGTVVGALEQGIAAAAAEPPPIAAPVATTGVSLDDTSQGFGVLLGTSDPAPAPDAATLQAARLFPAFAEAIADRQAPDAAGFLASGGDFGVRALWADGTANAAPEGLSPEALECARFADALAMTPPSELTPDAAEFRRRFDFHRIVAALGAHPALLRKLGLVVDIEVPASMLDALPSEPPTFSLQLAIERAEPTSDVDDCPWVAATTQAPSGFAVASRAGLAVGLAPIAETHRVVGFDFEAVGQQVLGLVSPETTGTTLPTPRSTGLRLTTQDAARAMLARATTAGVDTDGNGLLSAEELERGYRVDVRDETVGRWFSLQERHVGYVLQDQAVLATVDETAIGECVVSPADQTAMAPGSPVLVPDALVTWDGWSVACPRPGKVISADPQDALDEHRAANNTAITRRATNDPLTSTGLRIDTAVVPGTLPRLRFGRSYRMRLRSVDLTGGGPTLAEADALLADPAIASTATTEAIRFLRYEPVPPPVVGLPDDPRLTDPDGGGRFGETEHRLAVRSLFDPGTDVFGPTPGQGMRRLFPPKCPVELAERHGVFDDAIGGSDPTARRAAYQRAGREAGALLPGAAEVPWLVDPESAGVCLSGLPGLHAGEELRLPWPDTGEGPGPIELHAVATSGVPTAPVMSPDGRSVTVELAPGQRATVEVTSMIADEALLALPDLWRRRLGEADLAFALEQLRRHRHPQVTPATLIELVHATALPLHAPRPVGTAQVDRQPDQSTMRVAQDWAVHAPTTEQLDLVAHWSLPSAEVGIVEAGADGHVVWGPIPIDSTAPAGNRAVTIDPNGDPSGETVLRVVDPPGQPGSPPATMRTIDLQTTGHPRFDLVAVARSRFAEFFPEGTTVTAASEPVQTLVRNTRRPPAPVITDVLPLNLLTVDGTTITREGGWLRVWLGTPWFLSGWDELPAVLACIPTQPARPGVEFYEQASLLAPDPAREVLRTNQFAGMRPEYLGGYPVAWLSVVLAESMGSGSTIGLSDRGVYWDPQRAEWYTDIRVDAPQLYFPFVRLALVRDQLYSLEDDDLGASLRVSPVATADPIQVLPDRRLSWAFTDTEVTVTLQGHSYAYTLSARVADSVTEMRGDATPSRARVVLQRRSTPGDDVLAWDDILEAALGWPHGEGDVTSTGTFSFDLARPAGEYRLLVIEEDFAHGPALDPYPDGLRPRVVFAAHVPLPAAIIDA
ncbi:hypothetical protein [Micropruina sp.]|uniref:hypothetical protein n=1 Tax=Micropruina sp. TaxID=2737536 RepID=UPI0039E53D65